ncbi:hypothetical protein PR003_g28840 [Phytophthora rubi]|uniref:Uncharacterized protein n=1 Tax=Phytophthora rubi TaxID=129364 RepID=A0A6A4BPM4_9STRA|nr:hypothetical protein PR003_g28840 [Phytophthora rubi]
MFATFSPLFLVIQSACQLARDAHEKASFAQLGDYFAPYIASIYEAIEDAFQILLGVRQLARRKSTFNRIWNE